LSVHSPRWATSKHSRVNAPALKSTHEAGRRGGESTARQRTFAHLFSQPERVTVPRGFAWVSVGGAVVSEGVAGF